MKTRTLGETWSLTLLLHLLEKQKKANGSGGLGNMNREQVRAALEFSGENDRTRRLLLEMKPLRTKVQ